VKKKIAQLQSSPKHECIEKVQRVTQKHIDALFHPPPGIDLKEILSPTKETTKAPVTQIAKE
jgi:hypothetical protein